MLTILYSQIGGVSLKKDIKQKFILKLIPVFLLTFVLCNSLDERVYATEVQAEVEEATTETAYIDMSYPVTKI